MDCGAQQHDVVRAGTVGSFSADRHRRTADGHLGIRDAADTRKRLLHIGDAMAAAHARDVDRRGRDGIRSCNRHRSAS
jgi:hypothetical protein